MGFRTFLITTAFMIALLAIHMYYTEIRVSQTTKDLKETLQQEVKRLNEENVRQYQDLKAEFGKRSALMEHISHNTEENRRQYQDLKVEFGKMSALMEHISHNTEENRRQYQDLKVEFGKMSALMEHISHNTEDNKRQYHDLKAEFGKMSALMEHISHNTKDTKPKDCTDIDKRNGNGVYKIYPAGVVPLNVYCDMGTDNGGWTVFQRRVNGQINFQREWGEYEAGFGNLESEFWLGNRYLNVLTSQGEYELRIDLEDFENNARYAKYSQFYVGDVSTNYRLTVSSYRGDAGDDLSYHNGSPFTTKDRDNDRFGTNCAVLFKGAWWFNACHSSHLNGAYLHEKHNSKGINWGDISRKTSKMMMRRV